MRSFRRLFTLVVLLFGAASAFSQPPPPPGGGTGSDPNCWPPPCIPIDGGIVLLMAAGAAYGAKKIYKIRHKSGRIQ